MTVALKVTQVNDFDINLFMHNRCVFGSRSFFFFISFKCFLTWGGCKNNAGKVHPAVKLLSLAFFILLVRHCSASLHMLRQNHSKSEPAGNSNCITDTNSVPLREQKSHGKQPRPVWNVNIYRCESIYIFHALAYSCL